MSQPKIKRRIGNYEVGRTIGEGTFAKVKFARNCETKEPRAIKILDKEKVLKHKMAEQVHIILLLLQSFSGNTIKMLLHCCFIVPCKSL